MSLRRIAQFRPTRTFAAASSAALFCTAAAVAVAATSHARVETQQGKLGTMLAGGNGMTLYMLTADKSDKSTCYSSCARVWHPDYTRGQPTAVQSSGVNSTLLGTTKRKSGARQVTYNGHPLYFYSGDVNPGDMHGENLDQFGGHWYVVGTGGHAKKPVVFNPGSY